MEMPWIWLAEAGAMEKPLEEEPSEWTDEGAMEAEGVAKGFTRTLDEDTM
jgi:hypothetical protein